MIHVYPMRRVICCKSNRCKYEPTVIFGRHSNIILSYSGAGQEVGRSCIMLEFKGKKIMLDCGIHPGLTGMDALPYVDLIEADEIDLLFISQ